MQKKTRLSRSCKRSPMVLRDLTPTGIPLRVLACPVVRLRPKVMSFLSLLHPFRPAHRKSATLRLVRVRALFRKCKTDARDVCERIWTHGGRPRPPCPFAVLTREYELE